MSLANDSPILWYDLLGDTETNKEEIAPPAKKKRSTPRILDGTFYQVESIDGDNVVAKCKECDQSRKGSLKSTGNFLSHFRSAHSERSEELEKYLNRTMKWEPDRSKQIGVSAPPTSKENVCILFWLIERFLLNVFRASSFFIPANERIG